MDLKDKLMKVGAVLLVVLTLFVLVKTFSEVRSYHFIGSNNAQVATITVQGRGEMMVTPDVAEISLGVMSEAKDVKTAQDAAAKKNNAVIDYLKKAGVAEKDIKASYALNPQYSQQGTVYCGIEIMPMSYGADGSVSSAPARICPPTSGRPVIVGYEARHSLQVTVRDLDKLGELISGVGTLGVTDINGPYFKVEKEDEYRLQTRKDAIEDAQDKAKRLAKDLDVKLVRVISFNEDGGPIYYGYAKAENMAYGMGGDSVVPNIPAGENQIASNVMITYEIR